jgi:hypothetical protein
MGLETVNLFCREYPLIEAVFRFQGDFEDGIGLDDAVVVEPISALGFASRLLTVRIPVLGRRRYRRGSLDPRVE